ncbi:Spy0128 family protein [Isobaculum melis]|uniref:LPXTG-motif cell wall anchor domain-containing protein/pilin isopeptide linkage domain-containing protein n=1 Tax=Isobaculum melis TaxID=142588 RepID=A0A1H9Q1T6_9LACT|nr:FctA domain-containing protein [Isobaculum melis]SER54556.1 LPXTG-motif cell wall anchor domain-containing protein/pilin isopeptide linkage domain-containing protein [Isobaculum melis]
MNKKKLVKVLILIIGLLASSAYSQTVYADTFAEVTTSIPIQQQFESNKREMDSLFTYQLQAVNDASPMPTNQSVYEFTIKESETHTIPLTFAQPGVYRYQVKQVFPNGTIPGYSYDSRNLTIEVYVDYAQNQQLSAILLVKNEQGQKVGSLTFENSFFDPEIVDYQEDKGTLPQTGEEDSFLVSTIGIGCIWLLFSFLIYRDKLDNKNAKKN